MSSIINENDTVAIDELFLATMTLCRLWYYLSDAAGLIILSISTDSIRQSAHRSHSCVYSFVDVEKDEVSPLLPASVRQEAPAG